MAATFVRVLVNFSTYLIGLLTADALSASVTTTVAAAVVAAAAIEAVRLGCNAAGRSALRRATRTDSVGIGCAALLLMFVAMLLPLWLVLAAARFIPDLDVHGWRGAAIAVGCMFAVSLLLFLPQLPRVVRGARDARPQSSPQSFPLQDRGPNHSLRKARYRRNVPDEKPAASQDYDLPPWVERVLDICIGLFFLAVTGASITLIVVGTIVVSRALL